MSDQIQCLRAGPQPGIEQVRWVYRTNTQISGFTTVSPGLTQQTLSSTLLIKMLRSAAGRSLRCACRVSTRTSAVLIRAAAPRIRMAITGISPTFNTLSSKQYSSSSGLEEKEIEGRIMNVLKKFDKVLDTSKLTNKSHLINDLGLDSLDSVEVVMAIEEEFNIDIPDLHLDGFHSIETAVKYILSHPDAPPARF